MENKQLSATELAGLNYQLVPPANWDDWQALEPTIMLKKFIYGIYGIGAPIATIDGVGSLLTLHGRAVEVSLKQISYKQELHGFDKGNGGLHRTYLFKDFNAPLILRSLSSITDDEAIEVAKIKNGIFSCVGVTAKVIRRNTEKLDAIRVVALDENGKYLFEELINEVQLHYSEYQHLQQIGIALGVYYKGVYYSVETLQDLGIYAPFK
jgi:hypothetical protein